MIHEFKPTDREKKQLERQLVQINGEQMCWHRVSLLHCCFKCKRCFCPLGLDFIVAFLDEGGF